MTRALSPLSRRSRQSFMSQEPTTKLIGSNRKAFHDYAIEEKVEAGLILKGTEVKSLRQGRVNLREAYATVAEGKAILHNCHIGEYSHGNIMNHDPLRAPRVVVAQERDPEIDGKSSAEGSDAGAPPHVFQSARGCQGRVGARAGEKAL